MDRQSAGRDGIGRLKRNAATLRSLAALAAHIGDRPRALPVLLLVLAILRYAETAARGFVFETALACGGAPLPLLLAVAPAAAPSGDKHADAVAEAHRLEACLRALALALDAIAHSFAHAALTAGRRGIDAPAPGRLARRLRGTLEGPARSGRPGGPGYGGIVHDTS